MNESNTNDPNGTSNSVVDRDLLKAVVEEVVAEVVQGQVAQTVKHTVEDSMSLFLDQISAQKVERIKTPGLKDSQMCGWFLNETNELFKGFSLGQDDTVVDIGCGEGAHLNFCAKRGSTLIAIDQDENVLNEAVEKLKDSKAKAVHHYVSDCNPIPLEDGSVNRVICNEVLEHVDDPEQLIREVVRVGSDDAKFLIGVPDHRSEDVFKKVAWPGYFEKPNHLRIFQRQEFDDLVTDAGLVIEYKKYYGFYWSMWWFLFWGVDSELGEEVPLLNSWANTWDLLLQSAKGEKIKHALDELVPKSQIVVARKA